MNNQQTNTQPSELNVITKAKDLVKHTYTITNSTNRYPKKYRFTLVNRMQNRVIDIYECLLEANELNLSIPAEKEQRQALQAKALTFTKELLFFIELSLWLVDMIIDSTEGNVGLPIGNQSSQLFALLYLDGLDHFIKEKLGIKYYGRYMDDFYLIHKDKAYLQECRKQIEAKVAELGLTLNNKTQLLPLKNGIDFLGFHTYLTESGKVIRKVRHRSKNNVRRKLKKFKGLVDGGKMTQAQVVCSYQSWKGHASKGNSHHLIKNMDAYYDKLFKEDNEKCQNN